MKFFLIMIISLNLHALEIYKCEDFEISLQEDKKLKLFCFNTFNNVNTLEVFKLKAFQFNRLKASLKKGKPFFIKEIEDGVYQITQ